MSRNARNLARMLCRWLVPVALLLVARASDAVLIDFESVPGLTPIGYLYRSPIPSSSQLTTQLQLSQGVTFSSTPGYAALVGLGTGHATSGTNGIAGVAASGVLDFHELFITFTMPGDPLTPAATDFVSIRGDLMPTAGTATLEAFDAAGNSLGSATVPDSGGLTLSLSFAGMHSLRVSDTSNTIAFDDLAFHNLVPVPEPGTEALLCTGVALLVSRRRRYRPGGRLQRHDPRVDRTFF